MGAPFLVFYSPDPLAGRDIEGDVALIGGLAEGGPVTVILLHDGVLAAREGARAPVVDRLRAAGATVHAERVSLALRGIPPERLHPSVVPTDLDAAVALLGTGARTFWI